MKDLTIQNTVLEFCCAAGCEEGCREKNVKDCPGPWKFGKNEAGEIVEDDAFIFTCGKLLR